MHSGATNRYQRICTTAPTIGMPARLDEARELCDSVVLISQRLGPVSKNRHPLGPTLRDSLAMPNSKSMPWGLVIAFATAGTLHWVHASVFDFYLPAGINRRLIKAALWLSLAAVAVRLAGADGGVASTVS